MCRPGGNERVDGVDPLSVGASTVSTRARWGGATAASRGHVRVDGVDPSAVAGRRRRPEELGAVDSVDPIRGVGSIDGVDPRGLGGSTALTRARRGGDGGEPSTVPKGGGSDASLGGGWVAGGDPEAGVGRRDATRKQGGGGG